jgi:phage terminase large subunit-like protein
VTKVSPAEVKRGDGADVAAFIEATCRVTKESIGASAGELLVLRPWQRHLTDGLFARRASDGRYRHRQALIGVPRKNGKSGLAAGWALAGLFLGPQGGEVYACAGEKEQARIVFGTARRMVEMDSELSALAKVYKDTIEVPSTGSVLRVLSAESYSKEGLNPHLTIFDEVHVQPNRELWDVMALAQGSRVEPMMVGITTAGVRFDSTGQDSLCYRLYEHGRTVASGEVDDPAFYFAWWEPRDPAADHRDKAVWKDANPAFDDLVAGEDFESTVLRTPENEFRTKRLNQWVSSATAWLPAGAWDDCGDDFQVPDGSDVVLGFDGSFNNDSTALVGVAPGPVPRVFVVQAWERPTTAGNDWQVPILDVEAEIRAACRRWQVREIVCDPFRWARTYQVLEGEGLPILEFPQSPARMTPATQRFYEAVVNGQLAHDRDPRLARHVGNCMLKTDSRGSRLAKESKSSARKIDLAVAAVMAFDRAQFVKSKPVPQFFSF